jgi:hypothetical protein
MNQHPDAPEPPLEELTSLGREISPPPALEARIVAGLRDQGLVRSSPRWPWLQAAAAIVLLAAGVALGRSTAAPPASPASAPSNRYLFLLTDADASGDDAQRAEAYRRWAVDQRSAGRQISGERLAPSGVAVVRNGSAAVVSPEVQGFFVVSASDIEDAAAVARSSPHVQNGGVIIVRPIDTP